MAVDTLAAVPAAIAVCLLPGWFWARLLRASADRAEQAAFSVALSMALVPAVMLVPTRLLDVGVTVAVAGASALLVFLSGFAAYLRFGPAKGPVEPLAPPPPPLGVGPLALLGVAFALALGVVVGAIPRARFDPPVTFEAVPALWALPVLASLVLAAGWLQSRQPPPPDAEITPYKGTPKTLRRVGLPAVLVLALLRGYTGPALHDWPFMRGVDHYSHAVMAQLMMAEGRIEPYLIYPPGFHSLTAALSRLTGLEPLALFPVLAPLLLLLPALALYVLANRLWGLWCGIAAALFSVLLGGTYYYYNDAMYPNFVTSQFLMVLAVVALVSLCSSPPFVRGGLLFAVLGSSVVLYHQVASMYLAVMAAFVGLIFVPYLLVRERGRGVSLFLSLALLGLLSVFYALQTYDVVRVLGGPASSSTGTAVAMTIGTQHPYLLVELVGNLVSQPVAWLGLLGAVLMAQDLRRRKTAQRLPYLVLFAWTGLLISGSLTTLSGFPQRFGRDLGVPLAVLASFAFVAIVRSWPRSRGPLVAVLVASLAVLATGTLVGVRTVSSLQSAAAPSERMTITPEISEAGEWLRAHNEGGNIMVSPHDNQVPSRMMLAMGDYPALQSFEAWQLETPRDLPPTGPEPLEDVLWVMRHPQDERTKSLIEKHDVSYVVLYKNMPDRTTRDYWRDFEALPGLYRNVFENEDVLIVSRR